MKANALFLPLAAGAAMLLAACSQERLDPRGEPGSGIYETVAPANAIRGHIRVKFTSEPSDTKSGACAVDLSSLGQYQMVRTFPEAGRFEARHRAYGLHLWYDIFFDESLPLTKAANDVAIVDGVDIVEFVQPVTGTTVFPFNDPKASKQWHYYNPGTQAGAVAGSDVNAVPAWEVTTGRPDVIVAICDGGLQWNHPDMAQNMWVNEAELNGQPGVDDDGNGYIDDIYGYNFVVGPDGYSMTGTIMPGDHGTHVGGTVAAVNNNGIGACGIAGGDGSPESGVRLMSTQTSDGAAYIGAAFTYAADNGAVLINCSWTIPDATSTPESVATGIRYFNECAGIDPDTMAQTGPMAGGLCIFAAGNDNRSTISYPAMDELVMAVASIGADFKRAYYSNYGSWVDITAPGGDAQKGFNIYSTLPDNSYGEMQGTSMACPHVAGVAALVASQFGGPGFTRQNLIDILTGTANRSLYDHNGSYSGLLGAGLVDAGAAVRAASMKPAAVTDFSGEVKGNSVSLSWTVPGEDQTLPLSFLISWGGEKVSIGRNGAAPGSKMTYSISGLDFGTEYHFSISSVNSFGASTPGGPDLILTTAPNQPPVVTPLDGTSLTLKSFETKSLRFEASDPEGLELSCSLSSGLDGAKAEFTGGLLIVKIDALQARDGETYSGSLYVTDGFATVDVPFSYSILENNPPVASSGIENFVYGKLGEAGRIDLSDHFSDADGEELKYEISIPSSNSSVRHSLSGSVLSLTAASYGTVNLTIKAVDARGESATQAFSVLVRDGSSPVDLYPNPVKDKLFVRTGTPMDADVYVSNQAGAAVLKSEGTKIDPFAPLTVDMSSLPGGVYYVRVRGNGIDAVYPIAKQ